ncbi:MAG TPA: alginate lyase family protein [Blastocatellia bacterium]|nr:alginate lyase family protein [Blastocatellia bacterium]
MNNQKLKGTRKLHVCLLISGILAPISGTSTAAQVAPPNQLRVFLLDGNRLLAARAAIRKGDKILELALERLRRDAQKALAIEPQSVMSKQATPPSGSKHDYMSQAPYFWPNPKTADHLPYIRRDGERNPEINKISDHQSMDRMVSAVETLALAYFFDGDEKFAAKAAELLRVWFVDPATRMNPNLEYAQFIPGVNTGRGIGLIETRGMTRLVDAIGLLAGSRAWNELDQKNLEQWFSSFLQWMLTSKNGRDEAAAKNNHGTYYDLQVSSFALFLGRKDLAIATLESARLKRIAIQIEPDGRQPLELVRTKGWSYSVGNLDGLTLLAILGERVRVDLFSYRTADGRGIRTALDYLVPFALGEKKWPDQQIGEWQPEILVPLIRRGSARYRDSRYEELIKKIAPVDASDRSNLIY